MGTALFLTAVALLSLGVGAIVRHAALATSLLLGVLLGPIIAAAMVPESFRQWTEKLGPPAGLAVQQTRERPDSIDLSPWTGLGVTFAWAAAALLVAGWLIRSRDV